VIAVFFIYAFIYCIKLLMGDNLGTHVAKRYFKIPNKTLENAK